MRLRRGAHAPRVQTPVRLGPIAPSRSRSCHSQIFYCRSERGASAGAPKRAREARALPRQLELAFERAIIHLRAGRDHALESQVRELLNSLGADKLAHEIRVEWNPRLKTCAGRADYREKLISLNPLLLGLGERDAQVSSADGKNPVCIMHTSPSEDVDHLECFKHSSSKGSAERSHGKCASLPIVHDEIDRTLRHELAHLLAQWRAGRRRIAPHGAEWREACRDLGIADEARCHNLPFASKSFPRRYVYRCPNCKEQFPRVRRIRRAIACLACCRKHNGGDFDPRFRLRLLERATSWP